MNTDSRKSRNSRPFSIGVYMSQGLANCFYQAIGNFAGVIAALEDKKKKESK